MTKILSPCIFQNKNFLELFFATSEIFGILRFTIYDQKSQDHFGWKYNFKLFLKKYPITNPYIYKENLIDFI